MSHLLALSYLSETATMLLYYLRVSQHIKKCRTTCSPKLVANGQISGASSLTMEAMYHHRETI